MVNEMTRISVAACVMRCTVEMVSSITPTDEQSTKIENVIKDIDRCVQKIFDDLKDGKPVIIRKVDYRFLFSLISHAASIRLIELECIARGNFELKSSSYECKRDVRFPSDGIFTLEAALLPR